MRRFLRPFEGTTLASNYVFLRQIEHRLQIEGSQQRHELPEDAAQLDLLARRLGYTSGASFMTAYRDRAAETRAILDRFLAVEGAGRLWITDLADPQSDGAAALPHLAALGFSDPAKAREELLGLAAGPADRPFSQHVRHQFATIAPALLDALAASSNPDTALLRLGRVLTNLRAPTAVYDILKWGPELSEKLVTLVANSEYLSEILVRDPGLFDMFGGGRAVEDALSREDLERQLADLERAYEPEAAPYRLHDGELLRVGMRELFDNITVLEVGHELTRLAEVCLTYMLEQVRRKVAERYGATDAAFAILGLGKLGGRELGYGSDLDLVFVYDAGGAMGSTVAPVEYFAAIAAQTIRGLKEPTRYGVLYDIDARLRPDGNKGVLAISDARLDDYYQNEAHAWERLALVKVRAVAGDAEFGERIERRAREHAFSLPLTQESLQRIEDIRAKIVRNASPLDLKKDEGGLAEIEFAVRLLQLRHAAELPALKRSDVLGALDVLAQNDAIAAEDFGGLIDAYLLFRRIENRIRMMHGRSGSALPESPEAQADLAQRLRIPGHLAQLVRDHKSRAHAAYENIRRECAGA